MGAKSRKDFQMASQASINSKILGSARRFRKVLEGSGLEVKGFYLFGSYSKGSAKKWSDIDIAVVSPDFKSDRHSERVRLMGLSDQVDEFIEPHPFTPADFNDRWSTLAQEVKKYGVAVK